jgi:hypothetical protein
MVNIRRVSTVSQPEERTGPAPGVSPEGGAFGRPSVHHGAGLSVRSAAAHAIEEGRHQRFLGDAAKDAVGSASGDPQSATQGRTHNSCAQEHRSRTGVDGPLSGAGYQPGTGRYQKTDLLTTPLRENACLKKLVRANFMICNDVFWWLLNFG